METIFKKHERNGWEGKTVIVLGPAKDDRGRDGVRELLIWTGKGYGPGKGLDVRATVSLHAEGWHTHAMGLGTGLGDYSRRILRSGARCTEKAVRELHAEGLLHAAAIEAEARAWYVRQAAERAAKREPMTAAYPAFGTAAEADADEVESIHVLHKEGVTPAQIEARCGISEACVRAVIARDFPPAAGAPPAAGVDVFDKVIGV